MEALALLEIDSIAIGIRTVDGIAKVARVELFKTQPIDPGKYLILFQGDVGSVESSFQRGVEIAGDHLIDCVFLPQVHESIPSVLGGDSPDPPIESLGILETSTAAAIILATDASLKAAPAKLIRLHIARQIGGKGYAIMTGRQSDVEASIAAGASLAGREGRLVADVVIPAPAAEIYESVTRQWVDG